MRTWFVVLVVCAVAASLAGAWWLGSNLTPGKPESGAIATAKKHEVGVDEYMRSVDTYDGPVQVDGVVSSVMPEESVFTMIDQEEFKRCGVTNCASLTLPVRWSGSMPEVKQSVCVKGAARDSAGLLVFVAEHVENEGPETDESAQ